MTEIGKFQPGNEYVFRPGNVAAKKPESELSDSAEAIRSRRRRETRKDHEAQTQAIKQGFESQIESKDFAAQEAFLKECSTAVDVLLELDSFLLWTLHPAEAKALAIPVPVHVNDSNVDDALAYLETFASEYKRNPWRT